MSATDDDVRRHALSLPRVEERETWGHPTFRLDGHIFTSLPEEGIARIKASVGNQQELVAADPTAYAPAARLGEHGWVDVQLPEITVDDLRELITEAWGSIASSELRLRHHDLVDP